MSGTFQASSLFKMLLLLGAVLGAVLEAHFGVKALLFSAGFAALLGVVSLKIPRRWQRDYMPR